MTYNVLFYLILAGVAGGFINGLAGFGTALFALGFLLQILSPIEAVSLVLALSVVSGLQGLWVVRRELRQNQHRLWRFLAPALLGIPIGVYSLNFINTEMLKILIGHFMLFYGGFFAFRSNLPIWHNAPSWMDRIIGFIGGILGGSTGLSGAAVTIWLSMQPYSKHETRAVLQPYNVAVLGLSIVMLAINGAYNSQIFIYLAIILPAGMVASQAGIWLFKRMETQQFRRLLIFMMLASGLILLLRSLLPLLG